MSLVKTFYVNMNIKEYLTKKVIISNGIIIIKKYEKEHHKNVIIDVNNVKIYIIIK